MDSVYGPNSGQCLQEVTKDGHRDAATSFANTGVNETTDGRPYLGAALGTQEYIASQVESTSGQCLANINSSPTPHFLPLHMD